MRPMSLFPLLLAFAVAACKTSGSWGSELSGASESEVANPGRIFDKSQSFDKYTWLTAHNAFNDLSITIAPNQIGGWDIKRQLRAGVRGLMLDTYMSGDQVALCHNSCLLGRRWLKDEFRTISDFLRDNRDAVITIHFEDYVSRDQMKEAFRVSSEIAPYVFNPAKWPDRTAWPTLAEMIAANQRLLLFTQKDELSGSYDQGIYMFHDRDITSENYWSIGTSIFQHDYSCKSRWSTPLDEIESPASDTKNWRRLFVMNHFHGAPEYSHSGIDNRWDVIQERVDVHCASAQRSPNYIAVDFVNQGDVIEYVEWKNNGGIIAYTVNDDPKKGNVVCGFATAFARGFSLKGNDQERHGCENDDIRSIKILGMKAGQRVSFYDDPSGKTSDDYTVLEIKQDIPFDSPVFIRSLEANHETEQYRLRYHRDNGLDGKVSYIRIEPNAAR